MLTSWITFHEHNQTTKGFLDSLAFDSSFIPLILRTVPRTGTSIDQNFISGCRYFLKMCKLPVRTKTLLFVAGSFLFVIFLFPFDIVIICLCPTYQVIVYYFSTFCFVGPYLRFLCFKSKKHKGSDLLPSLMGHYHKSYLHVKIPGWMVRNLD